MEMIHYRNWWTLALKGVALMLLGVLAFAYPMGVIISLAIYVGIVLIVTGLLQIFAALSNRSSSQWGWLLVLGMFDMVLGAMLAVYPALTAIVFAVITGFWAVFTGVLQLVTFFAVRKAHASVWWLILITGIIAIVLGMYLISSPFVGAVALTHVLGIEAILVGAMSLLYSLRLRKAAPENSGEGPYQLSH